MYGHYTSRGTCVVTIHTTHVVCLNPCLIMKRSQIIFHKQGNSEERRVTIVNNNDLRPYHKLAQQADFIVHKI